MIENPKVGMKAKATNCKCGSEFKTFEGRITTTKAGNTRTICLEKGTDFSYHEPECLTEIKPKARKAKRGKYIILKELIHKDGGHIAYLLPPQKPLSILELYDL